MLAMQAVAQDKPRAPLPQADPGPPPERPIPLAAMCGEAPDGYLPDLRILDGEGTPEITADRRPGAWPGAEIRFDVVNRGKRTACASTLTLGLAPQSVRGFAFFNPVCPLGRHYDPIGDLCRPIRNAIWPPAVYGKPVEIACALPQIPPGKTASCIVAVFARAHVALAQLDPAVASVVARIADGADADAEGNALEVTLTFRAKE